MKVFQLIALLQKYPQEIDVEVNDNMRGEVYEIENVSHFPDYLEYNECIMLQINVL